MDIYGIGNSFVAHYYPTFDSNREELAKSYQDGSMLTFEGTQIWGSQRIIQKLTGLPFQQCQHKIYTVDCQPSVPAGGVFVFVSGSLQLDGEQHALNFSQMFHLMPVGDTGTFYVSNDIFRFINA